MNPPTYPPQHPDTAEIDEATSTSTAATPPPATVPRWAPTTPTGRKIRSDSKLEQLDPAQRARLRYWLEEEHYSYREAARLVHKEFGVYVGKSAICDFWRRHILPDHFDTEIDAALAFAAVNSAAFGATHFDTATLRQAKALVWSEISSPRPRLDTIAQLLDIARRVEHQVITHKRLALEERRVALREQTARPPRHPRASSPEAHVPTPLPPPPTSPPPSNLVPFPPPEPLPSATPPVSTSAYASPVPPPDTPTPLLTSTPDPTSPAPRPTPPAPGSLLPALPSFQSGPREIPQNPPLYPAYSGLVPPAAAAAVSAPFSGPASPPEVKAAAPSPLLAPTPAVPSGAKIAPSPSSPAAAIPTSPSATTPVPLAPPPSLPPSGASPATPGVPAAPQPRLPLPHPSTQPPQQPGFNLAYATAARSADRHRYPDL